MLINEAINLALMIVLAFTSTSIASSQNPFEDSSIAISPNADTTTSKISSSTPTTKTEDISIAISPVIVVEMTISIPFTDELLDQSSSQFLELQAQLDSFVISF